MGNFIYEISPEADDLFIGNFIGNDSTWEISYEWAFSSAVIWSSNLKLLLQFLTR